MHYFITTSALLLLLMACSPKNSEVKNTPSSEADITTAKFETNLDTFIYFSKGACFGKCPVYNFQISPSGHIDYMGEMFVDKIGNYQGQLSSDELDLLRIKINSLDFFNLPEYYPVNQRYFIPDLPSTTTKIKMNQQNHSIFNNNGAPNALMEFESFLSDLVIKHPTLNKNSD